MTDPKDFKNWNHLRTTPHYAKNLLSSTLGWLAASNDTNEGKIYQVAISKCTDSAFQNAEEVINFFKGLGFQITEEFLQDFEDTSEWAEKNFDQTEDDIRQAFGRERRDPHYKRPKPS